MSGFICARCRASLQSIIRVQKRAFTASTRKYSSEPPRKDLVDIDALLSKPTWSVRSLLPDPEAPPSEEITPAKLHHLLRLSALPLPKSPEEEAEMLKTLHSQLHFVKDIQKVDTEGVEPLQSIRDETEEGIKDITIGMKELEEAFEKEEIKGRNKRPRRKRGEAVGTKGVEDWDVLGTAGEKVELAGGKFFVVRSGKE
jgi:Asp-tRNA(Asn)/Glu-tRNA(Gln) amidotransferase C subunit